MDRRGARTTLRSLGGTRPVGYARTMAGVGRTGARRPRLGAGSLVAMAGLALALGGCATSETARGGSGTASDAGSQAEQGPQPPDGNERLGDAVKPLRYRLDLTIDPAGPRFAGEAKIRVELREARRRIRLHGQDLELLETRVESDAEQGGAPRRPKVETGPHGGMRLVFDEAVPAGKATLHFRYHGDITDVPLGLYRVRHEGQWFAFTQMQPLEARTVFPCFDEPGFKTPFELTVRVPEGLRAFANTPLQQTRQEADLTVHEFAPSKPLPTYLVAFTVGRFDVVEAPDAPGNTPVRIIAPKGHGDLAEWAAERTPPILRELTEYFGSEHPYAKLDLLAVPNFSAGAMENVGLVTFRQRLLLLDPDRASALDRLWSQNVIAHELAHMWFGNLVTLEWWNDLWLNEAFATWMASKIVDRVDPDIGARLHALQSTSEAMSMDAMSRARAIRQPIEHGGDVYNAFDRITYVKGAAVLRMLESWIGEDTFREGVRAYLDEHAGGTARTADLLSALHEASDRPVEATVQRFLDQPGVPLVRAEVSCRGGNQPARVSLKQERYVPLGSEAEQGKPWRLPVCMRYATGGSTHRQCVRLTGPKKTVTLERPGCPDWLHPNAGERGYYRWRLSADGLEGLAGEHRGRLSPAERVALPGHLRALLEAGEVEVVDFFEALSALARGEEPLLIEQLVGALEHVDRVAIDEGLAEPYARYVRKLLEPQLERMGREPSAQEPPRRSLVRPKVMRALAETGQHDGMQKRAEELTASFLDDPDSVAPSLLSFALPVAARHGDAKLWQQLRDRLEDASNPQVRGQLVEALGSFDDPELQQQSYDLLLSDVLRSQDFWTVLAPSTRHTETLERAWQWMTSHFDAIRDLLGEKMLPRLPRLARGFCSRDARKRVSDFFAEDAHTRPGTERNLGLALERIDRCRALREQVRSPLRTWLQARAAR